MEYNNLLVEVKDEIAVVTINRPKQMNALNQETLKELEDAFSSFYNNDGVKGIILTGSGEKAFVAGADIKEFADFNKQQGKQMADYGHHVFNVIENCPKPVVAAVNGFALGGGCELSMACHLRVASENAKFGQPEVNLGIIPGYGGTQRMTRLIGKTKAMELLMTADMINAKEAESLGLINYATSLDELMDKAFELLKKTKTKSPMAIRHLINSVNGYYNAPDGFEVERQEFSNCFETADFKEGTSAFMEKRKAAFIGK